MRKNILFWEDVEVGAEIPSLPKTATTQMLVKWAAASGDFNPLHYESTFAESQGVGRCIVHGQLKRAWLVNMLTDWIGDDGFLRKLSCQFRAMDYPVMMKTIIEPVDTKPTHWCKGIVTNKGVENEEHFIECDIWVENDKGEKSTPGKATIILNTKGDK
ncbi:MAG: MaoC/PaaZ C-terminal domain-containing protein [Pseudomonadota bacterium]